MIKQYIRDISQNPIGVVVCRKIHGELYFGYSLCSPADKFSKKIGTENADERAKESFNQQTDRPLPEVEERKSLIKDYYLALEKRAERYYKQEPAQKSKLQIILETAAFYNEDTSKRAMNTSEVCKYIMPDGRMCAFGRCHTDPQWLDDKNFAGLSTITSGGGELGLGHVMSGLMPEYQGHGVDFWIDIQRFHDSATNWYRHGLTDKGRGVLIKLIDKWK